MILSGVCIFLTLYLYYRFTEIQHSNLETQNKCLELQNQFAELQQKIDSLSPNFPLSLSKELVEIHEQLDNMQSLIKKQDSSQEKYSSDEE